MVEFTNEGGAVHVVPTAWLDEDAFGELVVWWPPETWSYARRNKAIEKCQDFDSDFTMLSNIRVLHTYSKYALCI